MYIPESNRSPGQAQNIDFMKANGFAILATHDGCEMTATHLPLLVDQRGEALVLTGHVARANPQSKFSGDAMAIFHGPHAYVSPTWYGAGVHVPTWNYVAIHAYGRMTLIEDEARVAAIITRLTNVYESSRPQPWTADIVPPDLNAKLMKAIVGFEIEVTRLEAKWKLSQNKPADARAGVAKELLVSTDTAAKEIGRLMAE
jgi:transcriptional regulator